MRVLWLTRAQLPAAVGAGSMPYGGWLEGLRLALERHEPDVELAIVSVGSVHHEPFTLGNSTYFSLPIAAPASRARRLAAAWGAKVVSREGVHRAVEIGRDFRPDLIHLHGTEHYLGLAALQLEPPCVATLQGIASVYQVFTREAMQWPLLAAGIPTRDFVTGHSAVHSHVAMKRTARVERRIVARLRYFMGQTEWDRNVLSLLNPSAEYFPCSRAVQPVYYETHWHTESAPEAAIVCVSSPMPYKGIETLLEAVRLLAQAGRGRRRLRIIGSFPDSNLWPMLSRLVRSKQLEDVVTWTGSLTADEIAAELSRAAVFVMPSHIENESNALIEAMLVGVPCVAAAVGGVPSVVRGGVDAVLYHDSDPFALAAAIDRVLVHRDFARSLGESARIRALERFDPEDCAHRTRAVYDEVLARG